MEPDPANQPPGSTVPSNRDNRGASPENRPQRARSIVHVVWAAVILVSVIAGLTTATYLQTQNQVKQGVAAVYEDAKKGAKDIASALREGFNTRTIEEQRFEGVARVDGKLRLELATVEAPETFRASDKRYILWKVYLGETVSEIRLPATFRYHLDLGARWDFKIEGQVCQVFAPPIQASLPVAIDTARMEKFASNGWSRFNKTEQLAQLEQKISPELAVRAGDATHINLVRETARVKVADFVRTWLAKEQKWGDGTLTAVVVVFADERQPKL